MQASFISTISLWARRSMRQLMTAGAALVLSAASAYAQTPPAAATSGTSGLALDTMMEKFVGNISGPIEQAVLVGSYIFGIYLLVKALFKCIKYSDEGSKGQQKFSGIWGTLMVGSMLIALPGMMTTVGMSLFGKDDGFASFNPLNYANPTTADVNSHISAVIVTIQVLLQVVGLISFTRGLSILRSVTDGNTQVTSMAGLTHVIAGALAWNFSGLVNTISDTIGYNIMSPGT